MTLTRHNLLATASQKLLWRQGRKQVDRWPYIRVNRVEWLGQGLWFDDATAEINVFAARRTNTLTVHGWGNLGSLWHLFHSRSGATDRFVTQEQSLLPKVVACEELRLEWGVLSTFNLAVDFDVFYSDDHEGWILARERDTEAGAG